MSVAGAHPGLQRTRGRRLGLCPGLTTVRLSRRKRQLCQRVHLRSRTHENTRGSQRCLPLARLPRHRQTYCSVRVTTGCRAHPSHTLARISVPHSHRRLWRADAPFRLPANSSSNSADASASVSVLLTVLRCRANASALMDVRPRRKHASPRARARLQLQRRLRWSVDARAQSDEQDVRLRTRRLQARLLLPLFSRQAHCRPSPRWCSRLCRRHLSHPPHHSLHVCPLPAHRRHQQRHPARSLMRSPRYLAAAILSGREPS